MYMYMNKKLELHRTHVTCHVETHLIIRRSLGTSRCCLRRNCLRVESSVRDTSSSVSVSMYSASRPDSQPARKPSCNRHKSFVALHISSVSAQEESSVRTSYAIHHFLTQFPDELTAASTEVDCHSDQPLIDRLTQAHQVTRSQQ